MHASDGPTAEGRTRPMKAGPRWLRQDLLATARFVGIVGGLLVAWLISSVWQRHGKLRTSRGPLCGRVGGQQKIEGCQGVAHTCSKRAARSAAAADSGQRTADSTTSMLGREHTSDALHS